jgi:phage terminase large subunit-like protein
MKPIKLSELPTAELERAVAEFESEKQRRLDENKLAHYQPYDKQRSFHEAGATSRERLLMAGNQLGKTLAGAFEAAMHSTGRYPDW